MQSSGIRRNDRQRKGLKHQVSALALAAAASAVGLASKASAASLYWDGGAGDTLWSNAVNWNTAADGATGGNPAAAPGELDTAYFDIYGMSSATNPKLNADISINGMVFNNTGGTTVVTDGTNRTVTVGAGGISLALGAAATFGATTSGYQTAVNLAGDQIWSNLNPNTNNLTLNGNVGLGGHVLTLDGGGYVVVAGVISGTTGNGIVVNGGTKLLLQNTAANTFDGGITVNNGQLTAAAGTVTAFGSGSLRLGDTNPGNSNAATVSNNTTGDVSNAITVNDGSSGILTVRGVTNSNSFSGTITLHNGVTLDQSTNNKITTFSGLITGNGTLTKGSSKGTVALTHDNGSSFTGNVVLTGGNLNFVNHALGDGNGSITFSGGTLQYSSATMTDVSSRFATSGSAAMIDVNGYAETFGSLGSNITSGLTLTSTTAGGTLTLTGNQNYTGVTTVTTGTLKLGSSNSIPSSNALTTAAGGTFDINGNDQTLGLVTNSGTITNSSATKKTLTIGDGSTGANAAFFSGPMNIIWNQGATSSSITTKAANTTFTGNLTLNANGVGTIGFSNPSNTGTITNSGSSSGAVTLGAIAASVTGITQDSATSNLILSGTNNSANGVTINRGTVIATAAAGLGKTSAQVSFGGSGTGNLDLQRTANTNFTSGINTSTAGGAIYVEPAAAGSGVTHTLTLANTLGSNTVSVNAGATFTTIDTPYGLTLSGLNSFNAASTNATFTINGNGSGTGTLTLSGGFNSGGNTNTLTLNSGTGTGVAVISGPLSGVGTLVLAGSAPVTIGALSGTTADAVRINSTTGGVYTSSGASKFTGGVTLSAGTLNINSAGVAATSGPLGNGGTFTINGGTTIDNTSAGAIVVLNVNPITIGGDFAYSTSAGTANNNLTLPGAVSLGADRTITLNGAGALTLSGLLTNTADSARTLTVNNGSGTTSTSVLNLGGYALTGPGSSAARNNVIAGSGNVAITGVLSDGASTGSGLTYGGSGTLILSGDNSFTGGVIINRGVVQLNHVGALNSTSPNTVAFGANAPAGTKLQLNGKSVTVAGLATDASTPGSPVVENANGSPATLTISNASACTYAGVLQDGTGGGALGLTKSGGGTLSLTGTNNYTGATLVSVGELVVGAGGSIASGSAVEIAAGATLGGYGTVGGAVTIDAGGRVAPGGSIGTLMVGSLTIGGNAGSLVFDIADAGATSDQINATALALSSLQWEDFSFAGPATFTPGGVYKYTLFHNASLSGSLGAGVTGMIGTNGQGELSLSGNDVILTVSVPEPSAILMLISIGGAGLMSSRRRQTAKA